MRRDQWPMRSHLRKSQVPRAKDIECDCVSRSGDAESGGHRDGREIAMRTGWLSGGNSSTMVSAGNPSAVMQRNALISAGAAVEETRCAYDFVSKVHQDLETWTWTWTLTWTRDCEGTLDYRRGVQGQSWRERDRASDAPSILFSAFCSTHCT